ncbi:hypothetical protein TSUD_374670 [Trifolium subterraneum]|uniref:Helicase ATP-binding domain-containing protein n=1 Tax=Trifolium subterraneum TaxID=3900 RepID=A0A2Z6NQB6_TRISU|nr:hypothetical protein TSUD_374670 [Trifolium subterraneum]
MVSKLLKAAVEQNIRSQRPSYRKLSNLRNHLPDVPILALTATAAPKVQKDVVESLLMQNALILKTSFNRPNIYYEGQSCSQFDSKL